MGRATYGQPGVQIRVAAAEVLKTRLRRVLSTGVMSELAIAGAINPGDDVFGVRMFPR
jgi:hypothetical protein